MSKENITSRGEIDVHMYSQEDPTSTCPPLAGRTGKTRRSPIRKMFDLAHSFDGEDLVHLEIGEPDFDTPDHVIKAATEAANAGATHYTSNPGLPTLRKAIADDIAGNYDPATEIIVTAGGMEALSLAMLTVLDPGEEMVVPSPCWPNYRTQAAMVDASFVEVPLPADDGFDLDGEQIATKVSDDTGVVLLTTPSNPTGRVFDPTDIRRVVEAAAEHDAYIIADEVYKDLTYGTDFSSVVETTSHRESVITIGSCSKTYAMTGWRVGWFAAPSTVTDAAVKFHESTVACAPAISQHAAVTALEGDQEPITRMHDAFAKRREYVVDRIASLPGISCPTPEGAFYVFLDISSVGIDADAAAQKLLTEYEVVTAPGSGFGTEYEGYLRISFANDIDRLAEGFDRFEAFVEREQKQ